MSYSLVDSTGFTSHIASVGGMNDLLDFVTRFRVWGPLSTFLDTGETNDIPAVIKDIVEFVPYVSDPSVRSTLLNLKQALEKSYRWSGRATIIE